MYTSRFLWQWMFDRRFSVSIKHLRVLTENLPKRESVWRKDRSFWSFGGSSRLKESSLDIWSGSAKQVRLIVSFNTWDVSIVLQNQQSLIESSTYFFFFGCRGGVTGGGGWDSRGEVPAGCRMVQEDTEPFRWDLSFMSLPRALWIHLFEPFWCKYS